MNQSSAQVEICLRIPGTWADPRELIERIGGHNTGFSVLLGSRSGDAASIGKFGKAPIFKSKQERLLIAKQ
jgi:hypothetical protein